MDIKLDHINLTVRNLNESIEWYLKVFGFKQVEKGTTDQGTPWAIVACNDSMICMSEYANRIPANQSQSTSSHRVSHFGIRVSDAEKWQKTLVHHKLQVNYGGVVNYPFSKSWYIFDPSGHEIEVSYSNAEELRFPSGAQS